MYSMVFNGLSLSQITTDWFKTPKPISGWDWVVWMDLRVGGGIEHLTVLITVIITKQTSAKGSQ